jgi:hypothetical protein
MCMCQKVWCAARLLLLLLLELMVAQTHSAHGAATTAASCLLILRSLGIQSQGKKGPRQQQRLNHARASTAAAEPTPVSVVLLALMVHQFVLQQRLEAAVRPAMPADRCTQVQAHTRSPPILSGSPNTNQVAGTLGRMSPPMPKTPKAAA